ncbi:MAG TPA: penicillin-binding protein 1A [Gammaproteobacteria bacterium]|nr:penicillin-binding protein 1A [Gammaproteobacteria bacterium]
MNIFFKAAGFVLATLFGVFTLAIIAAALGYLYLEPQLPPIAHLKDVRMQVPLHVYAHDGSLMAEFGEMRRIPVKIEQVPPLLLQAVLAAEDDRFYEHPGVDYRGLLRASSQLLLTGEKKQGGSTITMQVARNFFLGSEKTYLRKLKEILLALKIEHELSKPEILELYLNKIYLGNRSYGVAAAAQFYYGTTIDKLSVAQMAMIAGLPKAPSKYNPIVNLARATERRNYILERMYGLGFLKEDAYRSALAETETASRHIQAIAVEAPYMAEMVRADMVARYGEEAYTGGYAVYTTMEPRLQTAANAALRAALLEYDARHGYRKPLPHVDLPAGGGPAQWAEILQEHVEIGGLPAALVVKVEGKSARAYLSNKGEVELPWEAMSWARPYVNENRMGPSPKSAAEILAVGDIVRVQPLPEGKWRLAQVPAVQGAFVALNPNNGAISALVGGLDFYQSSFNRAIQADRQPGSSFKPFVYSAALEKGFTPATMVNDAPVVIEGASLGEDWRPENYGRDFLGPIPLRQALALSRNLVSIRVLRALGIEYARDYVTRFGFKSDRLPQGLSLALGSGVVTPLEMVKGFSVFASGGYRVEPYFIERIEGPEGKTLMQAQPLTACRECAPASVQATPAGLEDQLQADIRAEEGGTPPATQNAVVAPLAAPGAGGRTAPRVISAENAYLMTSMLQDVIRKGTGRKALALKRGDIAGKTGTTNEQRDAWFAGFTPSLVAISWVGFDNHTPLGDQETGGHAALPMWMQFMGEALKDMPESALPQPPGIVTARINPATGLLAADNDPNGVPEFFMNGQLPLQQSGTGAATGGSGGGSEILF